MQNFIEIPDYETIINLEKVDYIRSIEREDGNKKEDLIKISISGDIFEYEGKGLYKKISKLIAILKKEELDRNLKS